MVNPKGRVCPNGIARGYTRLDRYKECRIAPSVEGNKSINQSQRQTKTDGGSEYNKENSYPIMDNKAACKETYPTLKPFTQSNVVKGSRRRVLPGNNLKPIKSTAKKHNVVVKEGAKISLKDLAENKILKPYFSNPRDIIMKIQKKISGHRKEAEVIKLTWWTNGKLGYFVIKIDDQYFNVANGQLCSEDGCILDQKGTPGIYCPGMSMQPY